LQKPSYGGEETGPIREGEGENQGLRTREGKNLVEFGQEEGRKKKRVEEEDAQEAFFQLKDPLSTHHKRKEGEGGWGTTEEDEGYRREKGKDDSELPV